MRLRALIIFCLSLLGCSIYVTPLTYFEQSFHKQIAAFVPAGWPVVGNISSQFGFRKHPIRRFFHFHKGIDIVSPHNKPVHATAPGHVKWAGFKPGYGRSVIVDHGHGWETLYAHLQSSRVQLGESVLAGESIGKVGQSGSATGPHLHYEVHYLSQPQDPIHFIQGLKNGRVARSVVRGVLLGVPTATRRGRTRPFFNDSINEFDQPMISRLEGLYRVASVRRD